ncbi:MAG TPA: hypothetical protein VEY91_09430, partial [Candidatus Limnocylindria bacterium]|nr:hypothetical protein [Candidatus Limnocylindria bacterium]
MKHLTSGRAAWLAFGLAALTASCSGRAKGAVQMPPVPVEVAEAQRGMVRDRFRALGTIEAREVV